MAPWLLIDDSPEEAASFARRLSRPDVLSIEHMSAQQAASTLGVGTLAPAGVLMDVDLSNELGHRQTGPGMSQDIRVAQQKGTIPPFPIVRFSLREKVLQNIGRDASSDDVFDLKIEKDGLSDARLCAAAQSKLLGVRQIYDALEQGTENIPALLGLSDDDWIRWGSSAFQSDFELGDRVQLRASPLIRMMVHPGLLIEETILGYRLGVDSAASEGWARLLDQLSDYAYRGVACHNFVRWWAHGIEQWWQEKLGVEAPLNGCTIARRLDLLNQKFGNLAPLVMPKGSMGDRPWRYCLLTAEQRGEMIPVDPSRAVKVRPRSPMPSWLDPLYAALGVALQSRNDPRLDKEDLKRLQPFTRNQ